MATGALENVAEVIGLAVAPIFLLTAVAATLTVFINRLARIVDRGRALERAPKADLGHREELTRLEGRARLIYVALSLGVSSAILVSLLMTAAFIGQTFQVNTARLVALLFIGALFSYTGALLCLLREVFIAVGSFRLGLHAPAAPERA
ncbi:MAG: DUF2721 domain-containing protein [Elusimicrobia bacterium]|nr:DUF2721 domain-containing protein [Elusimicrobiota bacterium]